MKYLLPCTHCERKLSVDSTQAGESITCACGALLEIPSFREIRNLERGDASDTAPAPRSWNVRRGVVFAIGLAIVFCGIVASGFAGMGRLNLQTGTPPKENLEHTFAALDKMTAAETMDTWLQVRDGSLGPYIESNYSRHRRARKQLTQIMLVGYGVIALGVLVTAATWLVPKNMAPNV